MIAINIKLDLTSQTTSDARRVKTQQISEATKKFVPFLGRKFVVKKQDAKCLPTIDQSLPNRLHDKRTRLSIKVEQQDIGHRDSRTLRICSLEQQKTKKREMSKYDILSYASAHKKNEIVIFKNQLIKRKLWDKPLYTSDSNLSGSNKAANSTRRQLISEYKIFKKLSERPIICDESPSVFLSTSFWKNTHLNGLFSRRAKMIATKRKTESNLED